MSAVTHVCNCGAESYAGVVGYLACAQTDDLAAQSPRGVLDAKEPRPVAGAKLRELLSIQTPQQAAAQAMFQQNLLRSFRWISALQFYRHRFAVSFAHDESDPGTDSVAVAEEPLLSCWAIV